MLMFRPDTRKGICMPPWTDAKRPCGRPAPRDFTLKMFRASMRQEAYWTRIAPRNKTFSGAGRQFFAPTLD
jgi:hypothetical protein